MMTLANLNLFTDNGFETVVVQPSPYHYYSGMGPGMLGSIYEPEQIRFDTRKQVEQRGGTFIENAAVHIDPLRQSVTLSDNSTISYDMLSCNTGSHVSEPHENDDRVIPAKPISGLIQARKTITDLIANKSVHIGIVGGGPSAVEISCNIRQLADRYGGNHVRITLFAGHQVFPGKPSRLRRIVARYLAKRNIIIIEGSYVDAIEQGSVSIDQKKVACDLVFVATGVSPSTLFRQSGLTAGDGEGLAVNEFLQSINCENIFGGGDCIDFINRPLDKVGVYAVRQNPILLHNLLACLKGEPLKPFSPGGGYLLIYNMGGREGIFIRYPIIFSGRLAFWVKDHIDRRFIRMYQR